MKQLWVKIEYQAIKLQHGAAVFLSNMSLRKHLLFILTIIAVIPLCIATVLSTAFFRSNMKEQVIQASDNTVYLMSVSMNQLLENIEESVIQIISMPAVTSFLQKEETDSVTLYHDRKELEENYMKPILGAARYINSIEIQSENGGEGYSFGYNRSASRALSRQEYEDIKLPNNKYQKWFYIIDSYQNKDMVSIVYRRKIYEFGTGKQLGTIYVDITGQSFLNEMLHDFNYLGNAEIQLVGSDGNVIVGDEKFVTNEVMDKVYQENIAMESDNGRIIKKIEGKKYILNYSKLLNGWWIVHIVPYDEIFHSTDMIFVVVLIIFVLLAICVSFLAIEISQGITRPIEQLEKSMDAVKKGDFSRTVTVVSGDEVGRLCEGFNLMIQKINELFCEFEAEQRKKNEAELHNLQSQISPHFLYNILNSLMCDALLHGEKEYAKLIESLISLLKKSLDYKKEYITVKEEIGLLEDYLILQKFRYRNKFVYSVYVPEDVGRYRSLKLILQPVVENCILHGMGSSLLQIQVTVEKIEEDIWIWITDNGVGMSEERLEEVKESLSGEAEDWEEHIGLKNINRRIQLHFGERYGVRICRENGNTKIALHFAAIEEEIENVYI